MALGGEEESAGQGSRILTFLSGRLDGVQEEEEVFSFTSLASLNEHGTINGAVR